MSHDATLDSTDKMNSLEAIASCVDYSLMGALNPDPDSTPSGDDHEPRQVFSGHYVPVKPTPIKDPEYIAHSASLFAELGFDDSLALDDRFKSLFSGDLSNTPESIKPYGWATGYALSIFGTEYDQQCPFKTGNGYGDGRAMSVLEGVFQDKRWEMQLKGGGPTPYCRGADGRAVLRSSIREFLAQEHMHALGIPTSRSLTLYASQTEHVRRPWYSEGSFSTNPDQLVSEPVAISTRVAPSFIRVGQLELFGRRARKQGTVDALAELELLVLHLIDREYSASIDSDLSLPDKVIQLAKLFADQLTSLVTHWMRVGYCQGNFNSDNCAAGGFTLDYGPFGFCEHFNPDFQPWTGGGHHFSFFNQGIAAERNFEMFLIALLPLVRTSSEVVLELESIRSDFASLMQGKLNAMWAEKLGLDHYDAHLVSSLHSLMAETPVDFTLFFRELSHLPDRLDPLLKSFYQGLAHHPDPAQLEQRWEAWFKLWHAEVNQTNARISHTQRAEQMKRVNPKFIWREWLVVPAYQRAMLGDYSLVRELQSVLLNPYDEQTVEIEEHYYRLKPLEFVARGGVSFYSCSS